MINKKQALLFKKRWETVNNFQLEELRNSSPSEKLRQLSNLMKLAKDLKWNNKLKQEEQEVRKRWIELKKHYHE